MMFVFALSTLTLFDTNPASLVFVYAIIATAVNYFIGDRMILPTTDSSVASVADGIMAALVAWIMARLLTGFRTTFATLLAFAILVTLGEYFYRQFVNDSERVAP